MDTDLQILDSVAPDTVSQNEIYETQSEQRNTWALPFVSGYTYSVYWNTSIDWTSLNINPSFYFKNTDDGFIVRFNYTAPRELFDIGHILTGQLQTPLLTAQTAMLAAATCKFGDYFLDIAHKFLFICVSGRDKALYDSLNMKAIPCRTNCPKPGGFTKENFVRLWSNATQWPNHELPKAGDTVTVNGNWIVMLDVDVENLDSLTIDGDIYLTDANRKLSANFIWIRYGSLNAGTEKIPFQYDFTITINGANTVATHTIDALLSVNKYLIVTGSLNLYGKVPATTVTRLTANALVGATSITVASASGWAVGNIIGISPSFGKANELESVTIATITGNVITFTPALQYNHYGDASAFTNTYGTVDMRTSVGLFNRNIKILKGGDSSTRGFGVGMYAWNNDNTIVAGSGIIQGVQFS